MNKFNIGTMVEYKKTDRGVYVKLNTGFSGYVEQEDKFLARFLNREIMPGPFMMNNGVAFVTSKKTGYLDWYQARLFVKLLDFKISTDEKIYHEDSSGKSIPIKFNGIILAIEPVPSAYRMFNDDPMYNETLAVLDDAKKNDYEIDIVYTEGRSYGYYKILYIQKSYISSP